MLKGQWTGPYTGTSAGDMIAEFDQVGSEIVGTVVAHPSDVRLPSAFVSVALNAGMKSLDQTFPIFPIEPNSGDPMSWADIAATFPPETVMSTKADAKWRLSPKGDLHLSWVTDIGHTGEAVL